ncbi:hypothetical protein CVT24_000337 [Panaeolus cyanescens]|uniref:Uncharacterized protein n=1 Tax=Panaeolus cyanescens TaxID=181874 RepID=A0A409VJ07_9AGAR|nr:hypothetical protein CVT24_000337 [Panaeolus cyanescens]
MKTTFNNAGLFAFVMTFTAFILLALTTFSIPLISTLYFLHSTQANGVKFGIWGWCLDQYDLCSRPLKLGYTWEPEIPNPITKALVLYPISVVLVFLTLVSLLPVLCHRSQPSDKIFSILAWSSFSASLLAWLFTIGTFGVAKARNEKRGFTATYGNLTWMALVAVLLLLAAALSPIFFSAPPKPRSRSYSVSQNRHRRASRTRTADLEGQMRTKIGSPAAST